MNHERVAIQQQLRDDSARLQVASAMVDDVERVSNLAETQERIRSAERRLTEIDNELITLNGELADDATIGKALANFDDLFILIAISEVVGPRMASSDRHVTGSS